MKTILFADALTPAGLLPNAAIVISADGIIETVASTGQVWRGNAGAVWDFSGCVASPGWVDVQINGAFGLDFTENPDSIWEVARKLPRFGTTAFLPTIITSPAEVAQRGMDVLRRGVPYGWRGAKPLGLHLEGPFLNPAKKGAHNPQYLRQAEEDSLQQWSLANGVRLVTLAPELPGGLQAVSQLRAQGVAVSAGHSLANWEQAKAGFNAGIGSVTHLFNAMPSLEHRAPGLVGAALTDERVIAGLIADGIHAHPAMAALAWKMKGAKGMALVTDAMAALGMPPGVYRLGDFDVTVDETSARLADGTLAGSILNQEQALQNMMAFTGEAVENILPALGSTPARLAGLEEYGQIIPGNPANITVVNRAGQVKKVILAGKPF
jgi:N-acetylglucosamine-6-phosphate deacetylase